MPPNIDKLTRKKHPELFYAVKPRNSDCRRSFSREAYRICASPTQETVENKAAPLTVTPDKSPLNVILAGAHRSVANYARDKFRNPAENLAFFGVKPSSTVTEIAPSGGWYSEIFAPLARDKGDCIAAFPAQTTRGLKNFQDKLATAPAVYDKTEIVPFGMPDNDTQVDAFMKSFFDALKPGGVLGVAEHRAKLGTLQKDSVTSGYVTEQYVIERAQAAGFKLDGKSEINANPRDTKDYPKGVWNCRRYSLKKMSIAINFWRLANLIA